MKLRTYLILLVVAAVLPVVIFAGVTILRSSRQQTAVQEANLVDVAHAISLAVDRELAASLRSLQALATSKYLDSGDLRRFHDQATRELKAHRGWETIALTAPSRRQVVNTRSPFGSSLPRVESPFIEEIFETRQPVVSNLFSGALGKQPLIAVGVPVARGGKILYTLAAGASPAFLTDLLSHQKLPAGWIAAIIDRNKTIIARTQNLDKFLGQPAAPLIAEKSREAEGGFFYGETREEISTAAGYRRSELSGWTVVIGIPLSMLKTPGRTTLRYAAGGGLLLMLLGIALAIFFGRKIAASVAGLANAARTLIGGDPAAAAAAAAAASSSGGRQIAEVTHVARAIEDAAIKRKQAEEVVRASEQRLREIIDGLGSQMFVGLLTPDGNMIEANRPVLAAAGLKPEDVLGKPFDEAYWWSYSAGVRRRLRDAIARAARGEPSRYDVEIRVGENQFIVIDFSLQPLRDETGKVVFLVPSGNVITERKRAEEALRKAHDELGKKVAERTAELQTMVNLMAGREVRMGELKEVIRQLEAQLKDAGVTPAVGGK